MKRAILFLSLALALQLALALGLHLADNGENAAANRGKLLTLSADQIDRLRIEGSGEEAAVLQKVEGSWSLPEYFNAPVDKAKINELLTTLLGMERSWPVAKTDEAIKRFKVADKDFERRLSFKAGDRELAVLLLGTSPGFRKVHARLAGEKEVFDIPFSTYQASTKNADWVDKQQLWLESESVSAIELPDCRLSRTDGNWTLTDLAETEKTDPEKARQLLRQLTRLNIQDIYAKASEPLAGPADLGIRLEFNDGTSRRYDFFKKADQGHALLKVSGKPFLFKIGTALMKELEETTRSKLIKTAEAKAPPMAEPEKAEGKP